MFFFFKLDICCLFGWEFGKCFNSSWWSNLEEIIRWSCQPASQAHRSDAKEPALNGVSKCPLCFQCSGLRFLSRASLLLGLKLSRYRKEIFKSILKDTRPEIQRASEEKTRRLQRTLREELKGRGPSHERNSYYVPGTVLSAFHIMVSVDPHSILHCIEVETEAWIGEMACL